MMFNEKMAACIKVSGKVLREFKDTVKIPFGTEYQISLKNLHVKRAIVNVTIDGIDVIPNGLVVNAGQTVDIERFVTNGNLAQGNRFKFIERSESIEQYRGIKADDGLIRIEYQYEVDRPVLVFNDPWHKRSDWKNGYGPAYGSTGNDYNQTKGIMRSAGEACGQLSAHGYGTATVNCSSTVGSTQSVVNDAGITVPGSVSDQKFSTCSSFALETEKHVMILKLIGETIDNTPVTQPVTVKTKPKCVTCGKMNKANAKFCSNCGTGLVLV